MRSIHILGILVLLALAVPAAPADAGGVVSVCDEAHLLAALAGGGTVTFACSGTITLTAEIVIAADTTIDGSGQAVTISGNNAVRVFFVRSAASLTLNELTVVYGRVEGTSGGGVYSGTDSTLTVSNCVFAINGARDSDGGGIYNDGGTVSVSDTAFYNNGTDNRGGGIYNSGRLAVSDSTFNGNVGSNLSHVSGQGGGIYNDGGTVSVSDTAFSNNSAGNSGGGIYSSGRLAVSDSTFRGNRVSNFYPYSKGGGIFSTGVSLVLSNTIFSDNSAVSGGGLFNYRSDGTLTVSDSSFTGNRADMEGGGVVSYGGVLIVSRSTFSDNWASSCGGIASSNRLIVDESTFSGNVASSPDGMGSGGGICAGGTMTITHSTLRDNHAYLGGGVKTGGHSAVINSVLENNGAHAGGGIFNSGVAVVGNSTLSGNGANEGGAIYNDVGALQVLNSTLSGNNANYGGGISSLLGDATLGNTIVANNPTGGNCSGTITDGGGNLSYPDTTCPGINADPVLGPLQDNGGPTWTMALGEGSAAIDAADDAICAAPPVNNLDQRGITRPQGPHCDIGAVEQVSIKSIWLPAVQAW